MAKGFDNQEATIWNEKSQKVVEYEPSPPEEEEQPKIVSSLKPFHGKGDYYRRIWTYRSRCRK